MSLVKRPRLSMKFAGGVVRHLGLSMYHGAVPAIAEYIANGWDADAKSVDVTIPFDTNDYSGKEIIVEDKGTGMSYLDCDAKFLVVGRDARLAEGDRSPGGRLMMAHKGLGKLAGFGIANVVTVETCKDGGVTSLTMNYDVIDRLQQGETYYPDPVSTWEDKARANGTKVILRDIRLTRKIDRDEFMRSMGRRFSILSRDFQVFVNRKLLVRSKGPFEYHYPVKGILEKGERIDKDGLGRSKIDDYGEVRWWAGFTKEPIKDPEMRKISIIVRGKMANNPFDFDFARGTTGQLGLEYMTGEVEADFLDTKDYDGVSTGRTSLIWDRPQSEALRTWGRDLVSRILDDWSERRAKARLDQLERPRQKAGLPSFNERIQSYPPVERKEALRAVSALARIPTITAERFQENVEFLLDAVEDRNLRGMITEISTTDPETQLVFYELLREFDVLEALRVAKLVDAHLMIIRKFRELIETGQKEKPDMHEHLRKYPWLIDVSMLNVQHESQLQTIVRRNLGSKMDRLEAKKRVDFLWMGDPGRAFVIEVKRPGIIASRAEVEQLELYVDTLQTEFRKITDPGKQRTVNGYIIGTGFDVDQSKLDRLFTSGVFTRTWDVLLTASENSHREYLDMMKKKAPKDDPRILELQYMARTKKSTKTAETRE